MTIFKACDIRGVFGEDWNIEDARRIGRSLGAMVRRRGKSSICVGGDFRRTTAAIQHALVQGLVESGLEALDLGRLPTPVVYFAALQRGCDSVAIVTASHNPGRYNGIKFMVAGRPAVPELMDELRSGCDEVAPCATGVVARTDTTVSAYEPWVIEQARALVLPPRGTVAVGRQPLRVLLDTMGGTYTLLAPRILAAVGCSVRSLCEEIDPDFAARAPNPANDANLQPLVERVKAERADLAVALDGDGDRVVFVDGTGRIVRPEQIAAVLVRHCFSRPTVVFDLKCASLVPRVVEAAGGTAVMRPSGHGFIKTTMIERQAELGVEVSGHHFFGVLHGGDDGLFTALVVLGLMAKHNRSLAELAEPFPWPAITPDLRIPFSGDASAAVEQIAATCGGRVSRMDGVRAEYDGGWALVRASITEPAITFRFEGPDRERMREIAARFLASVPDLRSQVMEMINE